MRAIHLRDQRGLSSIYAKSKFKSSDYYFPRGEKGLPCAFHLVCIPRTSHGHDFEQ
jgi:hypothetical protein